MMRKSEKDWLAAEHPYDRIYEVFCRDDRKRRLYAAACVRHILEEFPDSRLHLFIQAAEKLADLEISWDEMKAVRKELKKVISSREKGPAHSGMAPLTVYEAVQRLTEREFMHYKMAIESCAFARADFERDRRQSENQPMKSFELGHALETRAQLELVLEIWGNPYRNLQIPAEILLWKNRTIPHLAEAVYQEQRFEDLPILGDALEEAGCLEASLIEHCRSGQKHYRGCWVLDALRPQ